MLCFVYVSPTIMACKLHCFFASRMALGGCPRHTTCVQRMPQAATARRHNRSLPKLKSTQSNRPFKSSKPHTQLLPALRTRRKKQQPGRSMASHHQPQTLICCCHAHTTNDIVITIKLALPHSSKSRKYHLLCRADPNEHKLTQRDV